MEIITIIAILIVLGSVSVGFVAGNMFPVISHWFNDDDEQPEAEPQDELPDLPETETMPVVPELAENGGAAPQPETLPPLPPVEQHYPKLVQVLRVFRDTDAYELHAEIDGRLVSGDSIDLSVEQHSALALTVAELQEWLGFPAEISQYAELSGGKAKAVKAEKNAGKDEEKKVGMNFNPMDMLANAVKASTKLPPKDRSIAEEVNAILQEGIAGTPLENKGLEITEIVGKGLRFVVGLNTYEFMDEIPDQNTRIVFQQAVKAWEAQVDEKE